MVSDKIGCLHKRWVTDGRSAQCTACGLVAPYESAMTQVNTQETNALDVQVGGGHYKKFNIQPVEYIHANGIGYFEGNVIKYVSRWRDKGGTADLEKAKHYIDLLIELEKKYGSNNPNQEAGNNPQT